MIIMIKILSLHMINNLFILISGLHWKTIVYFAEEHNYIFGDIGGDRFCWVLWVGFGINIMLCYTCSQYI